jgi:hypothetical protein
VKHTHPAKNMPCGAGAPQGKRWLEHLQKFLLDLSVSGIFKNSVAVWSEDLWCFCKALAKAHA